ncbi:MAG: F420-0:Gamma-glutamyl ligase [Thermosynechococcaceae cyanobacterium]
MIVEGIGIGLGLAIVLGWVALERPYRDRLGNTLQVSTGQWQFDFNQPHRYSIRGEFVLRNPLGHLEVMVPELSAEVTLLSKESLDGIQKTVRITPHHPDAETRRDGYWFAYIVKKRQQTSVAIDIEIKGTDLSALRVAWVQIRYIAYGPRGRLPRVHHEVLPLSYPDAAQPLRWRSAESAEVLPVPTHLLTQLDSCVDIVRRYVLPQSKPGDIITIGETPVAIMQGRYRHPAEIQPGWLAQRLCYFFLPTSSLATACGLQSLVDIVGPWRVFFAFVGGSILKIIGKPGGFYQLAGEQARLIDDVTGTLPPYDQFIVPGPENPQGVVDEIKAQTGLSAAIVDVNDLGAVKVLAASSGVSIALLEKALKKNPAGNADEQTPVVLIRPNA